MIVCVCVYIYIVCMYIYIYTERVRKIFKRILFQVTNSLVTLGSGKGLTPESWAKPLIYLISLLSEDFRWTLGVQSRWH